MINHPINRINQSLDHVSDPLETLATVQLVDE